MKNIKFYLSLALLTTTGLTTSFSMEKDADEKLAKQHEHSFTTQATQDRWDYLIDAASGYSNVVTKIPIPIDTLKKLVFEDYRCAWGVLMTISDNVLTQEEFANIFEDIQYKATTEMSANYQYFLGIMYEYGVGIKKDFKEDFERYQKASNERKVEDQLNLVIYYSSDYGSKGRGVLENKSLRYLYYFMNAANKKHDKTQKKPALCYERGIGVSVDLNKAVGWYKKAADQGHRAAQHILALLLRNEYKK